jgi:hypothetical protein
MKNFGVAMKIFISSVFLILYVTSAFSQNISNNALNKFVQSISTLSDPTKKLDSFLVQKTLKIALEKECRGPILDQSGDYYVCIFKEVGEQDKLFQLLSFESASRHPEPNLGGTVTWVIDAKKLCLTRDILAKAFHRLPTFPRFPDYPEIRPSNPERPFANTYDLVLHEFQPKKENIFIAIYEKEQCAVKIKLYKN